jgi:hypothetical protein
MKIVPEPERLDSRVPLGILGVSIVTLLLSYVLTVAVRSLTEHDLHAAAAHGPRELAPSDAPAAQPSGMFGRHDLPLPTRQLPERLREYGWVDRAQGVVHIPIERAKRLYLERKAGATRPASQLEGGSR